MEKNMTILLLSTVSGSRLYGLSHEGSDHDRFDVYGWDKFRPKQSISGIHDVTKCSIDRFLLCCNKGVPQYLEAIFSHQAAINEISYITNGYRPNMQNVRDTYCRTIKSFWQSGLEEDSFKKRRHAVRLHLNLLTMMEYGRFNPTLTDQQIETISRTAKDKSLAVSF